MSVKLELTLMRVSEGDAIAFKELFDQFSPEVYGFALKLTRSESGAEEIVQEVFLKIWTNRAAVQGVVNFPAYLYTITRNLCFNVLKKIALEHKVKADLLRGMHAHTDTDEAIIYQDYQRLLNIALASLPPQQRIVYSLCHGEGLKYEEAAEKLHISKLTVKAHMQQAIRAIKSHFRYFEHIAILTGFLFF